MKLTKRAIDNLIPRSGEYFAWDDEIKGFGVRVSPSGRMTYLIQYRSGGRTRRVKISTTTILTPDEARSRAKELLGNVARGDNPAQDISTYRKSPTVGALCDRFLEEHVAHRCKPTTQAEYKRSVDLIIKPAFAAWKIEDVTRADVAKLHHENAHRPYQANRTLGVISKMFNLAEIWGLRPEGSNPCRHIQKYAEKKRERFLSPNEISHLGRTLDRAQEDGSESPFAISAFKLLILTGCRLGEIQTLKWEYLSPGYMHLPDSKTGARRIPLPPAAQAVLDSLPRTAGNEWIIEGKEPGQHLTDLQRPWRRVRAKAEITDVRIHDLRHTYASNALAQGLDIVMVGRLLGHSQIQTSMRYVHLADDPVKEAAQLVSNELARNIDVPISSGPPNLAIVK